MDGFGQQSVVVLGISTGQVKVLTVDLIGHLDR